MASAQATDTSPTCSDELGIAVHGQHIVGDYVTDIGGFLWGDNLGWPPDGSEVGQSARNNGGVYLPGGPGPTFHFENGVAPGASFCTSSQSPGVHL
jgi:hypothetical protein